MTSSPGSGFQHMAYHLLHGLLITNISGRLMPNDVNSHNTSEKVSLRPSMPCLLFEDGDFPGLENATAVAVSIETNVKQVFHPSDGNSNNGETMARTTIIQ